MTTKTNSDFSVSYRANRAEGQAGPRAWAGLALLSLPTILLGLDLTLLHLALPAIAADLAPTSTQALWIVDIYGFMIAGFLITMGTLGDRIGRRRLLMIGAAAFGAASVLAAYSSNAAMLIAARAALGVAGATLMPSTLALISSMFTNPRQRALAVGVWATMFALGMALGPIVGGLLLGRFWWGAAFLLALPIVGILLLGARILLPEYRVPHSGRIDPASVLLSLFAMLAIIYGVKQFAKEGPEWIALAAFGFGIACTALFITRQKRLIHPLLDVRMFNNHAFSAALVVLLVGLIGVGGTMLLVAQYLQLVAGLSPFAAGLWMGPPAFAMVIAGIAAPLVARRIRPAYVVAAALALSVVGYLMLARLGSQPQGNIIAVSAFAFVYVGLGTIAALGTDLVVGSVPAEKAGAASAMSETVQELGASVGIALLGSLASVVYRHRLSDHLPETLEHELHIITTEGLAAVIAVGDQLPEGLVAHAQAAFMAGFNAAATLAAAGIALLAIVAAITLRHVGVHQ